MKYRFMYDHRKGYRNRKMADTLRASRTGYHIWVQQGCISKRHQQDVKYLALIHKVFKKTKETYGPRRLSKHLREQGHVIGRTRVERLMRENNIIPKTVKKFKATTNSNHDYPVAPNLLNRNFTTTKPNTVWVTDITYVATGEGWLYLAAVLDLCTGKIIGWAMGERRRQTL